MQTQVQATRIALGSRIGPLPSKALTLHDENLYRIVDILLDVFLHLPLAQFFFY